MNTVFDLTKSAYLLFILALLVFSNNNLGQSFKNSEASMLSTFLGGSANDGSYYTGANLAIDSNGDIIIAGSTASTNFPVTEGVVSQQNAGNTDLFVAKLSADLSTLLAATYIGGFGNDEARAIEIDSEGNIYISGITESSNFPVTSNSYDNSYGGSSTTGPYGSGDVFILKLSNDLTNILAATYFGGSNHECCADLAIAPGGNIVIAGATASVDMEITGGTYDSSLNTGGHFKVDGYIATFDANLQSLVSSTFIGGFADDFIEAIEFNSLGELFVTGWTSASDYPTTVGAYDRTFNFGTYDGFISKLSGDLTALMASTYLGGSTGWDFCYGLTIDSNDNVFVSGHTAANDYPTTTGTAYTTYIGSGGNNSGDDAFIAKFNSDLSQLSASSFIGGSAWECSYGLDAASNGDVYVCGTTSSSNFPTSAGVISENFGGGSKYAGDVFISRFNNDLTSVLNSTYLGNTNDDDFGQVSATNDGLYLIGATKSPNFPISTNAYDKTHNGSNDIFVIKIDEIFSPLSSLEKEVKINADFTLNNNYPNPFNPSTNISFSLKQFSHVQLDIFNTLGEHVITLIDEELSSGEYDSTWDGKSSSNLSVNSGIYFCRLSTKNNVEVSKLVLQK